MLYHAENKWMPNSEQSRYVSASSSPKGVVVAINGQYFFLNVSIHLRAKTSALGGQGLCFTH